MGMRKSCNEFIKEGSCQYVCIYGPKRKICAFYDNDCSVNKEIVRYAKEWLEKHPKKDKPVAAEDNSPKIGDWYQWVGPYGVWEYGEKAELSDFYTGVDGIFRGKLGTWNLWGGTLVKCDPPVVETPKETEFIPGKIYQTSEGLLVLCMVGSPMNDQCFCGLLIKEVLYHKYTGHKETNWVKECFTGPVEIEVKK